MKLLDWDQWVIDAAIGTPPGTFCFCPVRGNIDGDFQIVTGMNYIGKQPPEGILVGIIHEDGQVAVDKSGLRAVKLCYDDVDTRTDRGRHGRHSR